MKFFLNFENYYSTIFKKKCLKSKDQNFKNIYKSYPNKIKNNMMQILLYK